MALGVRAEATPADLDELVIVQSLRGAPMAVAPEDVPVFTAGLAPPDEEAAQVLIGNATQTLDDISAMEALDRVSAAVADALADGPLERDAFHQALRERLPPELLRWCENCGSHHVHPSLWRATGVRGVLAIVGREGRTAVFGTPPEAPAVDDPGAELARRFLRAYGPARPPVFTAWSGLAPSHARALWDRAGELAEVELEGKPAWLLAEDLDALAEPPPARGVRLVPGMDPYLSMRDRETLAPDKALRKRLWKPLGNPGAVLVDGVLAGLWRPAKKGKRLVVTVDAFDGAPADALAEEADRLAPFRGAETAEVAFGTV
jgi:hypothetical protein